MITLNLDKKEALFLETALEDAIGNEVDEIYFEEYQNLLKKLIEAKVEAV